MNRKEKRIELLKFLLLYSILFGVICLGVFSMFIYKQKSLCWTKDAVSQYVPKAYYFIKESKAFLSGLLHGELNYMMYDFHIGYGDAVPLHMEPMYYLFLFFDQNHIEFAYGFVLLARVYAAGLSMAAFLHYFKRNRFEILCGSFVYVFSGFLFTSGIKHAHFMIPMITLPLMILAIEFICQKKNWYFCTIMVAISFFCGYYFTYMNTFAMGIYFLVRFFGTKEDRTVSSFFKKGFTIAGSYLLGIGISNITFFNTFAAYVSSSRTERETSHNILRFFVYSRDWFKDFYTYFISSDGLMGNEMRLGFIPLCLLCVIVLFMKKGNGKLKALFVIETIMALVPVFGYILGGFSTFNNRWSYMYAFVVGMVVAFTISDLLELSKKNLMILGVLILPYLYLGIGCRVLGRSCVKDAVRPGMILFVSYLFLWFAYLLKKDHLLLKRCLAMLLVICSLWYNGFARFRQTVSEYSDAGNVLYSETNTPLGVTNEIVDDSFYRSYTNESQSPVQNAGMILDFNGTLQFTSTLNGALVNFYRMMGVSTWSLVRARGLDERDYINALASVKYYMYQNEQELPVYYQDLGIYDANNKQYHLYENEQSLPIGYTYDTFITEEELAGYPVAAREEAMLQSVVLSKEADLLHDTEKEFTGTILPFETVTCENAELSDTELRITKKGGSVTFTVKGVPGTETYLCLKNMHVNSGANIYFTVSADGRASKYFYHGDKHIYSTGQDDFIFNIGYFDEPVSTITFKSDKKCTIQLDDIYAYCQNMESLPEYIEQRTQDQLEHVKVSTNSVSGTISVDQEKMLVMSIPYQNGWTAYVDGKKAPLYKCNLMFSGVMLEPGEHQVEFRFVLPGLYVSLIVTSISLAIFILLLLVQRRKNRR